MDVGSQRGPPPPPTTSPAGCICNASGSSRQLLFLGSRKLNLRLKSDASFKIQCDAFELRTAPTAVQMQSPGGLKQQREPVEPTTVFIAEDSKKILQQAIANMCSVLKVGDEIYKVNDEDAIWIVDSWTDTYSCFVRMHMCVCIYNTTTNQPAYVYTQHTSLIQL